MNVEIEDQLKDELRQRADGLPTRSDPYTLVHRRVVRSARRRKGALVVCVVALLVAAVVAAPGLLDIGKRNAVVSPPSPRVDGSAGSPMDWPTRGSLAGDRAYVQQSTNWLVDRASTPSNPLKSSDVNVLYAGDVGGRRLVVGAYEDTGKPGLVQTVSLAGPAGSEERLRESPMAWTPPRSQYFDHLVAFLLRPLEGKPSPPTTVVVLAASSVRALSYSLYPDIQPDGDIQRRWRPLIDEDSEQGVVTASLDTELVAPGAFRIRAETAENPVVEQPDDFTNADFMPRTPIREMAEQASEGKFVGELAPALQDLEMSDLGWKQITSVRIPWRIDHDGEWVGLELGLASGGVVEVVFTTSHTLTWEAPGARWQSLLYTVRAVPADLAGREPFFWPAPGEDSCRVYGFVPKQLAATEFPDARVAAAEVVIDGKPSERSPAVNGQLVTVDYCDLLSQKVNSESVAALEVRLLDENGKKLWSGFPAETNDVYPRALDVQ